MTAPTRKGGRVLTEHERALWQHVTREDKRLHSKALAEGPSPAPLSHRNESWKPPALPAPSLRMQPLTPSVYADVDGSTALRLKRGDYPIHARLDLHGMHRAEAYDALKYMLELAYAQGKRCVLVITGKGSQEGGGVLKALLPHWLNDPQIRAVVLAFGQAAQKHGGAGATYVLVKRKREAGHG